MQSSDKLWKTTDWVFVVISICDMSMAVIFDFCSIFSIIFLATILCSNNKIMHARVRPQHRNCCCYTSCDATRAHIFHVSCVLARWISLRAQYICRTANSVVLNATTTTTKIAKTFEYRSINNFVMRAGKIV